MKKVVNGSNSFCFAFLLGLCCLTASPSSFAREEETVYGDWGVGGTVSHQQVQDHQQSTARKFAEGGVVGFLDSALYTTLDNVGMIVVLWEEEMSLRLLGGYGFGDEFESASGGFYGMELRGNCDIGMSFFGILPLNQALEDSKLRITNKGIEGKTLIGTTHVLPVGRWNKIDSEHRMFYLSVSHGFRYHSELGGWAWAVQPKVRLVDLDKARLEARYLFGFWRENRREHSGSLALDISAGKSVLIGAFGEVEYLQQGNQRGDQIGWTVMLEVTRHFLYD